MPKLTDAAGPVRELTDGERWSRALLDRLRADRFGAAGWRRFFADSFERAHATRHRRPQLVRQSRRWGALGLAAAAPFGIRPAGWWALWWAMLDWHLGMLETADGRERPLGAQDALTLARLWAVPVVRRHPEPWLVVAAMASDLGDGVLARRRGPTRLGRDFDSTADTAFQLAALRGAAERHGLDPRLGRFEAVRLGVGSAIVVASYFGASQPPPIQRGRGPAAALAAAGTLLAVTGRGRGAAPLLAASTAYRIVTRLRAR